jgi:hypothetical protein
VQPLYLSYRSLNGLAYKPVVEGSGKVTDVFKMFGEEAQEQRRWMTESVVFII